MKWGNVCNSDFRRRPNSLIHKEILQNKTKNSKKKKRKKRKESFQGYEETIHRKGNTDSS